MADNTTQADRGPKGHFRKGQSGNPRGASAHQRHLAAIRRLTVEEVAEIGSLVVKGNFSALKDIKNDPNASVLKIWMAALIVTSMQRGDWGAFNCIMDRLIGKPSQTPYTEEVKKQEASSAPALPW